MKNKLGNLNDHLFAQLERLADEGLSAEEIEKEVARTDAIVAVSDQITGNAKLQLGAAKLFAEHGEHIAHMLPQIGQAQPSSKTIEHTKAGDEGA